MKYNIHCYYNSFTKDFCILKVRTLTIVIYIVKVCRI